MHVTKERLLQSELDGDESSDSDGDALLEQGEHESDPRFLPKKIRSQGKRRLLLIGIVLMSIIVVVIVIATVVHSSSSSSGSSSQDDVIKPYVDNRTYKVIHLNNELRVLLISDPQTDYGAAAMAVNVGSMSDPPEIQGLAHFCEHMLFLGTKKYPNESLYSDFLSQHGGYFNAFTSQEETNYYFKVEQQALFGSLDRFAQFFIAPLFTESSAEREMHAVDSEHQKNLNSEDFWVWQITKDLANPTSPFHKFSTGNIDTLNVSNIRSELLDFHKKHYSSNQMQLVVLGRESTDNLTSYVTSVFSLVPNKNVDAPSFPGNPYPSGYSGKQVWIPAISDQHTVTMMWPVQPVQEKYRSNPIGYLSGLLGDEGPGSVVAELKDKGWVIAVAAGDSVDIDSFSMFQIQLTVTDKGLLHIDHIVDLVFDYIELIKRHGITKAIWQDTIDVNKINFRFTPKSDPADYARNVASVMRYTKLPADFLGPPSRAIWNSSLITSVIGQLTPDNLLLFLLSRPSGILKWPKLNVTEPWYNIKYHVASISQERLDMWRDVSTINASLALPPANDYIPRNLELLASPKENTLYPSRVLKELGLEVWWKQDTVFRTPEIHLYFGFYTPFAYNSSFHAVLMSLYIQLVNDALTEPLYAASLAGYTYSLESTASGVMLQFYGYSDHTKMGQFIDVVIQQAKQTVTAGRDYLMQDNRYLNAYEEIRQQLESYPTLQQPYQIAYDLSNVALEKTRWRPSELLEALKNVTVDNYMHYTSRMSLAKLYVKCLAHGNLDQQKAVSYARTVVDGLGSQPAALGPPPQRVHLHPGDSYVFRMKGLNVNDTNSAIRGVYQIGPVCFQGTGASTDNQTCSSCLLQRDLQMGLVNLIIKNACFEQLRTKEQLGYIVACQTHTTENILSFQVIIQSALYNASYLTERAEAFLETFGDTMKSLAENSKGFEDLKQSLVDFLQSRDLSLLDATNRFWEEISNNQYQFDQVNQLVSMINSVTIESVVQFYNRYLDGRSGERRRFVVELYGRGRSIPKGSPDKNVRILHEGDLTSFKRNASFYGNLDSDDVIKPDIDNRRYKVIHLSNELRVLLISDPETDYGAASMSVNVGSMSNPPEVIGLAHFCEHMLFLGTKKYPNESSYAGFLSQHGGYDNAFTEEEQTNYFFEVEQQSLFEALDRFAQFFIAPLFTKSSTKREMHAVDSEHQKNLDSENRWVWQLTKDLAKPVSRFHRFTTGNINTLNVDNVHSKLLEFYKKHYSSNQMQLVVLGRESIENLTSYVANVFSLIPNKHVDAPCFPVYPYPPGYTGKQVWIPVVTDSHTLIMKWPVQPVQENYRSNPFGYLSYLLGDDGPGSVVAVLRDSGWATALSAAVPIDMESFSMFQIGLSLTDEGLPHIDRVVDLVFDYIELIKRDGIRKEIGQDIIDVYAVNFRYTPKSDPASYVKSIASAMRYKESPADFLGPPSRAIWNPKLIASVIGQLTPDNLLLFLLSHQSGILNWPNLAVTEPWYKIKYRVTNISKEHLDLWHDVSTVNAHLNLPPANNYIPRNLTLLPLPKEKTLYPTTVLKKPGLEVWWKQDTVFRTPEIHLVFGFYTPLAYNSSFHAALIHLYVRLVSDALTKPLYAAFRAGYSYSLGLTASGFTLHFYGYSDHTKMEQFVDVVIQQVKQIANAGHDYLKQDNRYHIAFEEIRQLFENYPTSNQPFQIASAYSNVALDKPSWTVSEQLEALKNITEDDFMHYASQLLDKVYLKCLAHGNIDRQKAVSYALKVVDGLGLKLAAPGPLPQRVHLQPGDSYIYGMKGLYYNNINSAIRGVYQIGPVCFQGNRSAGQNCSSPLMRRSLRMGLISLIIENACFDQLRTKEQLGYIVSCGVDFSMNIESFYVAIQSALYNASYLTERAEAFLTTFGDTLKSMAKSNERFEDLKRSLVDLLRSKDLSLVGATSRFWGEISSNQYQFDRVSQLLSVVDNITIDSVVQFYSTYLDGRSRERRRFVVELYGHGQPIPQGSRERNVTVLHEGDLASFKQNAAYYDHP